MAIRAPERATAYIPELIKERVPEVSEGGPAAAGADGAQEKQYMRVRAVSIAGGTSRHSRTVAP